MSDMLVEAPHTIEEFVKGYEEGGTLRGLRCANCGFVTATWGVGCSRCGCFPLDETVLSPKGKVVAFTIQTVPGDEFLNDAPYAYVVVDLDGGGRVTGWMPTVRAENDLAVGERVHFVSSYRPGVQFAKDSMSASSG